MRVTVVAVGKWKNGPERGPVRGYTGRLSWPVTLKEVERTQVAAGTADGARGRAVAGGPAKAASGLVMVALDQRGQGAVERAAGQQCAAMARAAERSSAGRVRRLLLPISS